MHRTRRAAPDLPARRRAAARTRCTVLAGLCVVALSASAQVYKHVGPDGRVYYSDKPPAAAGGPAELKPEIRSRAPRPEDDPMHAAMSVYAHETMVETFYRFCRDTVPESAPALREARDRWNARHRQLAAAKIIVLHDHLSIDQLRRIAAETEATHLEILQKVRAAPPAEHAAWCRAAPDRFEALELNPARDPTLARTLLTYKPRNPRPPR